MKKTVVPALILTAICLVVVALLAVTNLLTEERIAAAEREATLAAAKSVLPAAKTLSELTEEGFSGYVGCDAEGKVVGYVFVHSSKGYGGDVTAIVGISQSGTITGVSVRAADETPGLGANVTKGAFTSQFVGRTDTEDYTPVTGATYSSNAAEEAIVAALDSFQRITEQEASGQ